MTKKKNFLFFLKRKILTIKKKKKKKIIRLVFFINRMLANRERYGTIVSVCGYIGSIFKWAIIVEVIFCCFRGLILGAAYNRKHSQTHQYLYSKYTLGTTTSDDIIFIYVPALLFEAIYHVLAFTLESVWFNFNLLSICAIFGTLFTFIEYAYTIP
jgi:hypothetical protein